ncbi:MAG TPA: FAD:protein FMN transferase [Ktedonobacterales bacterium]
MATQVQHPPRRAPSPALASRDERDFAAFRVPDGLRREVFRGMGTMIEVLAPAPRANAATEAVRTLFAEWEAALSRFRPESELSRLNERAGEPMRVSALLYTVLAASLRAAAAAGGLYDPTLAERIVALGYDRTFDELVAAGGGDGARAMSTSGEHREAETTPGHRGRRAPMTPAADARWVTQVNRPREATSRVGTGGVGRSGGWRQIHMDPMDRSVTLPAGVGLDFGGIAKGMAVDAAIGRLRAMGLRTALVNAGGDLVVLGAPPDGQAWTIAVTGLAAGWIVPLRRGALATSGIVRRHWRQGDRERHHLIDPRTDEPSESGMSSVSVAAERCEQAEVAAKTAFLLGMEAGGAFLRRHGLAGLLFGRDGSWSATGGWPMEGADTAARLGSMRGCEGER